MLKGKSQKELIQLSKQLVQPLLPHFHKGQAGRVAVIGGSEDYTGAPFFSCHAAALVGSDMNHLICEKLAAPVIKLYSPDLMVHPYLYQLTNPDIKAILNDEELKQLLELPLEDVVNQKQPKLNSLVDEYVMPKVTPLLNRIDIVVIGPGFGRDPLMVRSLIRIVQELKVLNKPIIIDADALFTLSLDPLLVSKYPKAIITPNVVEFDRIAKRLKVENSIGERNLDNMVKATIELSKALGGVIVFRKGERDIIAQGDSCLVSSALGSPKRVGGQGDTLSGSIATLVNWSNNYDKGLWEPDQKKLLPEESKLLACFAASTLVRTSSYKAYEKYGRAMQTSNIHLFLGDTYNDMYGEGDFVKL